MSKEFIEAGLNKDSINKAVEQENQLSYFISSKLQDNYLGAEYVKNWAERKYQTNDYFLNWVKSIFKTSNFLLFSKYLRFPLPSAKIVKSRMEPQLERVFMAEDSAFNYEVNNVEKSDYVDILDFKKFNDELFNRLLYKHNSLIVADIKEPNNPYRYFLDIDKVESVEYIDDKIKRIAFKGCVVVEEKEEFGYIYIDTEKYAFYDKDYKELLSIPHDLERTPVHFISKNLFNFDYIIRESLFSYVREELEEYTFLKTLQKMTEPNGAFPVVTRIETDSDDSEDQNSDNGQPNSDQIMGSQSAKLYSDTNSLGEGAIMPGTIYDVPLEALKEADGTLNTALVERYLNFHYLPVEILEYINTRVKELEVSIIITIVGDFLESTEGAKNELQIEKSMSALENTLRAFSETLNRIRTLSDYDMLALRYGKERVKEVFVHFGTDFFLESQTKLFDDLAKAPNPIERKNILVRINQNKYKNNYDASLRSKLLYDLLPFITDKDFEIARGAGLDNITLQYQLRFDYWIGIFEARYGDILSFYQNLEVDKAQRLSVINNLVIEIIKENTTLEENTNT